LTVVIVFYVVKIVSGELFRMLAAADMSCLTMLSKNWSEGTWDSNKITLKDQKAV
jgi:hypothetical protein